jgi:hypothetical protein
VKKVSELEKRLEVEHVVEDLEVGMEREIMKFLFQILMSAKKPLYSLVIANVKMCVVVALETRVEVSVLASSVHVANVMVKAVVMTYELAMGEEMYGLTELATTKEHSEVVHVDMAAADP